MTSPAFNADRPEDAAVPPNAPRGGRPLHDSDVGRHGVPACSALSERAIEAERERMHAEERQSRESDRALFEELGRDDNLKAMRDAYEDVPVISVSDQDAWIACVIGVVAAAVGAAIFLLALVQA